MAMKKNVPLLMSGEGCLASFTGGLVAELQRIGVPDEDIHAMVKGERRTLDPAKVAKAIARAAMPIKPPAGGRIHILEADVNYGRKWEKAVFAAGKTGTDWDILKVGHLYVPRFTGIVRRRIVLVNFGRNAESAEALAWAESQGGFPIADPWTVFSIAEQYSSINKTLNMSSYMGLVSLETCELNRVPRVPDVWWFGTDRYVDLDALANTWDDVYWFVFVCE